MSLGLWNSEVTLLKSVCFNNHTVIFVIKNYSTALHCLLWAAGLNLLYIKITVQLNLALNWQHDFTQGTLMIKKPSI